MKDGYHYRFKYHVLMDDISMQIVTVINQFSSGLF